MRDMVGGHFAPGAAENVGSHGRFVAVLVDVGLNARRHGARTSVFEGYAEYASGLSCREIGLC
jgi:hypothetical protein